MDETLNERQRPGEAFDLNEPLAAAYYLKEELRMIRLQPDKVSAEKSLDEWIKKRRTPPRLKW
ncbi:MAG: transposase [Gammaproteobacteria bacterium]